MVSRPPVSTPVRPREASSPWAAIWSASGQEAGSSSPSALRTSGVSSRSRCCAYRNANRPLSQIHSSLTSGSLAASRRMTLPRRWSVRVAQPPEQCSQTDGDETRSKGRERNRYAAEVSAPTGQIWMVLPEKVRLERVALAGADLLERAALDQLDHRVARDLVGEPGAAGAQHAPLAVEQHLRGDGEGLLVRALAALEAGLGVAVRHGLVLQRALAALVADRAVQRVVDEPRSSITPFWAFSATGEVRWVLTTIPSVHVMVQDAMGLRWPSTSTMHWRQAPAGSRRRRENRGISMPSCSAARMTRVPFGTLISTPSIVSDTRSSGGTARLCPA
ncbi:hypothetical protein SVIOM74S_10172 [Streptomyces violarus]